MSKYEEAARIVEGLRVHVDDDPHSTCPDGCGWFNYAAMKLREAGLIRDLDAVEGYCCRAGATADPGPCPWHSGRP